MPNRSESAKLARPLISPRLQFFNLLEFSEAGSQAIQSDRKLREYWKPDAQTETTDQPIPLILPPLYEKQEQIKDEGLRFNVLDIGRRAGKTFLGIHLALETAALGYPVGWFAPSYKYVLEVWRDLLRPVAGIATKINATERRIELPNGGLIEVWTLENEDAGRGRKYKRAIVDEAAMVAKLKTSWEQSIRPTLTDLQGDAWFLSTPKGLNYFYDLFQRGQDQEQFPNWKSWQLPSAVNPFLPPSEIDAAREELPEQVFQQEYLAEFLSGDGAVFRNVDACLTALDTTPADHKGHLLVAGVDWARLHDFTAISVICCHCQAEVALDRFNQIGWAFQRERLLALLDKWNVEHTIVESNSIGAPNLEALHDALPGKRTVAGFETTAKSKPKLIQSLALCFERERLRWLADATARHELIAYEATVTENGHTKYGAPEGGWDDTVIARALAWRAASLRIPVEPTVEEQIELALPLGLRRETVEAMPFGLSRDYAVLHRDWEVKQIKEQQQKRSENWSGEIVNAAEDPWAQLEKMGGQL